VGTGQINYIYGLVSEAIIGIMPVVMNICDVLIAKFRLWTYLMLSMQSAGGKLGDTGVGETDQRFNLTSGMLLRLRRR
jgi:hypothetical protein